MKMNHEVKESAHDLLWINIAHSLNPPQLFCISVISGYQPDFRAARKLLSLNSLGLSASRTIKLTPDKDIHHARYNFSRRSAKFELVITAADSCSLENRT
eukprot:6207167-Pleurochrysis_carterae.AAC.2